jgi:hypothetical protein
VLELEFCVHKLSSDPMDGTVLEVPRKHGGVSYVMALKISKSDLCEHSSTSAIVDRSLINQQVHNQTVVMTLAFLYQLNIGFSPFLVSVSSI